MSEFRQKCHTTALAYMALIPPRNTRPARGYTWLRPCTSLAAYSGGGIYLLSLKSSTGEKIYETSLLLADFDPLWYVSAPNKPPNLCTVLARIPNKVDKPGCWVCGRAGPIFVQSSRRQMILGARSGPYFQHCS